MAKLSEQARKNKTAYNNEYNKKYKKKFSTNLSVDDFNKIMMYIGKHHLNKAEYLRLSYEVLSGKK